MSDVLHYLDDRMPLAACSPAQRAAIIARGEGLRRLRRARLIGVPVATAVVAISAIVALADMSGSGRDVLTPTAPAPPELVLQGRTGNVASYDCRESAGDSAGSPDVDFFSLDTASEPLFHYGLVSGRMPSTGVIEFRIQATSADGRQSRQFVQRIVDGQVTEQYIRDPDTGARLDVPPERVPYDAGDGGPGRGGARYPKGAAGGLGDGWTWSASLSVNGTVVDSCDQMQGRP